MADNGSSSTVMKPAKKRCRDNSFMVTLAVSLPPLSGTSFRTDGYAETSEDVPACIETEAGACQKSVCAVCRVVSENGVHEKQQKTSRHSILENSMGRPEGSRNTLIRITYSTVGWKGAAGPQVSSCPSCMVQTSILAVPVANWTMHASSGGSVEDTDGPARLLSLSTDARPPLNPSAGPST